MYTRVLVPLDGSKLAEEILPFAERLSNGFKIPVHLLTVINQHSVAAMKTGRADASGRAAQAAQDYLSVVSERISRSIGPECVTVAEELNTVIVPLDGSPLAEQALPHATAMAKALKLRVILVRVTSTLVEYQASEEFYAVSQELIDELEHEATEYLARQALMLRQQGFEGVEGMHLTGSASIQVIEYARKTPGSFVAMCTHGRSGVQRWAFGSVTDQVISHIAVPVLVIRAV